MGSIFFTRAQGSKFWGKKGLRDQNNGKKIGINGSRIYHDTTLLYIFKKTRVHLPYSADWHIYT